MKWKIILAGLLIVGLLAGGTTAAFAGSTEESTAISAQEIAGDLNGIVEAEIIPSVAPGDKLSINGGFRGVWGIDSEADQSTEPSGYMAGLYGSVTKADGTTYNFMGGVYTRENGRLGGFLVGKYADGSFWGTWHSATSGVHGQYGGTYNTSTDDVEAVLNNYEGKWQTSDGTRTGYIKGNYFARVSAQMTGKFAGKWVGCDVEASVDTVVPQADGSLKGHIGVIHFADGTDIRYFRGGWSSDEGCATGRLQGIGIRGHFYGIWHDTEGKSAGYLTGQYGESRFRGLWGNMGENPQGKLWGRYVQITDAVEIQPMPDKIEPQAISGEVQLQSVK